MLCVFPRALRSLRGSTHTPGAVSNVEGIVPKQFKMVSDFLQEAGYEIAFLGKSHIQARSRITTGTTISALPVRLSITDLYLLKVFVANIATRRRTRVNTLTTC